MCNLHKDGVVYKGKVVWLKLSFILTNPHILEEHEKTVLRHCTFCIPEDKNILLPGELFK